MLDVGGRPFLDHLLDEASRTASSAPCCCADIGPAISSPSYKGRTDSRHAHRDGRGSRDRPAPPAPGAGGRPARRWFFLVNGDSLFDFNWLALCPPPATPSTSLVRMALASGVAGDALWTGGRRWPAGARLHSGRRARTGRSTPASISCARRSCRSIGPAPCSLERDVLPGLATEGLIEGCVVEAPFIDIGIAAGLRARTSASCRHPEAACRLSRSRRRAERGHGLRSPPRPGPLGRRRARNRALAERCRILRVHRDQPGRRRARPLQRRPRRTICTTG